MTTIMSKMRVEVGLFIESNKLAHTLNQFHYPHTASIGMKKRRRYNAI